MTSPSEKFEIFGDSRIVQARYTIKFIGYPTPTINWRDIHGNDIPWSLSTCSEKNCKYIPLQTERTTTLKIQHPNLNDSGTYILYADNGHIQKEHKFQLLIEGMFIYDILKRNFTAKYF